MTMPAIYLLILSICVVATVVGCDEDRMREQDERNTEDIEHCIKRGQTPVIHRNRVNCINKETR